MITKIQQIANDTRYTSNKAQFVTNLYWKLYAAGIQTCIVNDRYIEVDGVTYQFINNRREMSYKVATI